MSILETIDEIDRLISNSAAVSTIKSLLISLREQAEAIEARVRSLESKSKVKRLEGENAFLRSELDSALKQIQELEKAKKGAHGLDRSEGETRTLTLLAEHPDIEVDLIARTLHVGEQTAQLHLDDLFAAKMVNRSLFIGDRPTTWRLAPEGRRYLFDRGLLQ